MNIKQLDKTYIADTYARFPLELVSGKGAVLIDENGNEYIDLGSGIAVNTLGAADDGWIAAVTQQLHQIQHTSNLYYTGPCAKLAEVLCERTGMKKVFFSNSGAEANECAIKAARLYAANTKGKDAYTIITLQNSFHGRTITTLAATGQDIFHNDFTPLTEGFVYSPANDIEALTKLTETYNCAAIMLEPVQGEGGVLPLTPEFMKAARTLADEKDLVLIVDEVQTGNGRTGSLYAYMQYGIMPDIVTTAKGLGGGLPLGATLLSQKLQHVFTPGSHGSTFGGNPVCCAGALYILSQLNDTLLSQVKEKSDFIFKTLSQTPGIKSVSGLGLMIGVETEKDASSVVAACMKNGVLVLKAKNKVRLLPPLTISMEQLHKAISILQKACEPEAV